MGQIRGRCTLNKLQGAGRVATTMGVESGLKISWGRPQKL